MLNICFLEQNPNITDFLTGNIQTKTFYSIFINPRTMTLFSQVAFTCKTCFNFHENFCKVLKS
jgi:hypothetical protein